MGEFATKGPTTVERHGDVDLVITRVFDAPPRIVYDAWTQADLFQLWWAPKSQPVPMIACTIDARTGGGYSVTFGHDLDNAMTFFGKYLEVVPNQRMIWTNEEGGEDGQVTTVTFEEAEGGKTLLTMTEHYPNKAAFEESAVGMEATYPEQFDQLAELLAQQA